MLLNKAVFIFICIPFFLIPLLLALRKLNTIFFDIDKKRKNSRGKWEL
jgi:hypothetical protein